jgi:hypothetical protein
VGHELISTLKTEKTGHHCTEFSRTGYLPLGICASLAQSLFISSYVVRNIIIVKCIIINATFQLKCSHLGPSNPVCAVQCLRVIRNGTMWLGDLPRQLRLHCLVTVIAAHCLGTITALHCLVTVVILHYYTI